MINLYWDYKVHDTIIPFYFRMIYVNDCSIRVVRSCIKIFVQEIFVQILHMKIIYNEKKANYGMCNKSYHATS